MSLKSKLNSIEKKLENENIPLDDDPLDKESLLFMDYPEYQTVFVEWFMSMYQQNYLKAEALEKELERLSKSLQPVSHPNDYDVKTIQEFLAVKIVDYMEKYDIELDDDRWIEFEKEIEERTKEWQ